jgi:hypothetical protein
VVLGLGKQDVDMIANGIDFDEGRIAVFQDADHVGVEGTAFLVPEERTAAFRAEHEMDDDVGERLGHVCDALTGLKLFLSMVYLGLQPRLSRAGLSALTLWCAWLSQNSDSTPSQHKTSLYQIA